MDTWFGLSTEGFYLPESLSDYPIDQDHGELFLLWDTEKPRDQVEYFECLEEGIHLGIYLDNFILRAPLPIWNWFWKHINQEADIYALIPAHVRVKRAFGKNEMKAAKTILYQVKNGSPLDEYTRRLKRKLDAKHFARLGHLMDRILDAVDSIGQPIKEPDYKVGELPIVAERLAEYGRSLEYYYRDGIPKQTYRWMEFNGTPAEKALYRLIAGIQEAEDL